MIPKFRAWDKSRNLMIDEIVVIDLYHEYIGYLYSSEIVQGEIVSRLPINDVIIMQSTGLEDKNGVEIYDGDIVQVEEKIVISGKMTSIKVNKVVKYKEDYAQFLLYANENGEHLTFAKFGEVIGNIYENKELLEAVK